jgi:hypothetical protein
MDNLSQTEIHRTIFKWLLITTNVTLYLPVEKRGNELANGAVASTRSLVPPPNARNG